MGKKSKKHKKHKKTKKPKKHLKHSESSRSSSESSSDSSVEEWVEKHERKEKEKTRHDEWMSQMSFGPTYSSKELKAKNQNEWDTMKEKDRRRMLEPGQSDRELNPYWKNGGIGLPTGKKDKDEPTKTSSVLDANYLRGVLEKARCQAKEENRSLESVVADRYGSLKTLERMISLAERKQDKSSGSSNRFRKQTMEKRRSSSPSISETSRRRNHSPKSSREPDEQSVTDTSRLSYNKCTTSDSEVTVKSLTNEEMNQLASKLVKAEIMGNKKLIGELTEKLNKARQMREATATSNDIEVVTLMQTNDRNFTQPMKRKNDSDEKSDGRKKRIFQTHADGRRVKYFEDDDKYSLTQMFEKEQMLSASDSNAEFIRLSSKGKSTNSDDFVDLFMDQSTSNKPQKDHDLQKAINKHKNKEKALDNCLWCLTNNKLQKHLIISTGSKAYLSVPYFKSLTEGHCLISPIYHATCATLLDEDVWDEILDYCKRLVNLFHASNQDVVFFESAMNFKHYPHMVLHCVPIPYEVGNLAPIYFKKAIMECEKEWAQNKKLVDVKRLDIKRSIPKGLPYFAVHFGMDNGYAHVIEDEKDFPRNFAQEIIGGLLDLDHRIWHKVVAENFEAQCKKVNRFRKWWNKVEET